MEHADEAPIGLLVTLAERAQRPGGAAALDELLARLREPIRQFVLSRVGWAADAEDFAADVTQETLVRVAMRLGQCRATTDQQLIAWVLTIARREAATMLRATHSILAVRSFRTEFERALSAEAAHRWVRAVNEDLLPDPEGALLRVLAAVYDAEGATAGQLVRLHVVDRASWAEVARLLQTTPEAAKRRFQRAQRMLRRAMQCAALPASRTTSDTQSSPHCVSGLAVSRTPSAGNCRGGGRQPQWRCTVQVRTEPRDIYRGSTSATTQVCERRRRVILHGNAHTAREAQRVGQSVPAAGRRG